MKQWLDSVATTKYCVRFILSVSRVAWDVIMSVFVTVRSCADYLRAL